MKNLLSKITSFIKIGKRSGGPAPLNPSRDWIFVLLVLFVILMVSVLWNVWFFYTVLNQKTTTVTSSGEQEIDVGLLEKMRAGFEERKGEEERYRSEYRFIDPSR